MNITLRQLRVFAKVASRLSFSRAAEELYLTQPAVSMQIKQLEDVVGLPLFERLGRKIFLTPAGEELNRLSRVVLARIKETENALEDLKDAEAGRLVVSVASTVYYFAIRALAEYCRRYPKTKVSLKVTNRSGLLQLLENNETDLVLMGRPPGDQDLIAEPVMENPLVIIAPSGHPLAEREFIPLAELSKETFLMREFGSGTRNSVERFLAERNVQLNSSMEMNTNEAIKHGVAMGLGLGIVSAHTVVDELKARTLVVLSVEEFPIQRHWYLVHRQGKNLTKAALAFTDFVRSEAARLAQLPLLPAPQPVSRTPRDAGEAPGYVV